MNVLDKILLAIAPTWGLQRIRARAKAELIPEASALAKRHFEAAGTGYRTENWARKYSDANLANGPAIATLRVLARDLQRNNGWAKNGLAIVANNTVGWGIMPRAESASEETKATAARLWKEWAEESTQCDAEGRLTFYGLQHQAMETVARDGEILVRLRPRRPDDELAIPLQLQVMEGDFLDTNKDGILGVAGGPIIQGVEFDMIGRRAAYWLFDEHPGSGARGIGSRRLESRRIPASSVIHVYRQDRPGQVRGVSWLAAAIVALKDFDEFEDATIVRHKIAAMLAAFVTDDGTGSTLGESDGGSPAIETLQPGMIQKLSPGKQVVFSNPPAIVEGEFTVRVLQKVAAALGTTYEELTQDLSQVNYSSARMGRLSHWAKVYVWRWNMLVPQFCTPIWRRAMEMAQIAGELGEVPSATWTAPGMPMLDPDKEGLAAQRLVRSGAMTPDQMVREQGLNPEQHWAEYAANMKKLDELGIVLDSDVRKVSQAGLTQARAGVKAADASESDAKTSEPDA